MITIKTILVSNDFGEAAAAALMYGRSFAGQFGASLHVVHVVQNICLNAYAAEHHAGMDPCSPQNPDAASKYP